MRKQILILVGCIIALLSVKAQQPGITGKIMDRATNKPIENAVVLLLTAKDSVIYSFARSANDGHFTFKYKSAGDFVLLVTHPLYAEYIDNIEIKNGGVNIPPIRLLDKSKLLETIIIRSGGAIKIKGDTTIYTADSFNVSANANVEELLKKLPGIQVDKNGEIKAMGEKVEKILVDGEEFFGDDPGMAVKNIRADAVKEVQVFDKKSDQAAFTGIDDGNTKKTINLTLKEDRKKGYFGKISGSGGTGYQIANRYNNNVMIGSFKGDRKISAFFLNGNTGQDGLSWQDNQKYGGDEMNFEMTDADGIFSYSIMNGNNDDEVNINTSDGFIRNVNAGLQYSNKWQGNQKINFTPKYNLQDYSNTKSGYSVTQLGDSSLNEYSSQQIKVDRYNIKNSIIYDYKINTANSLKLSVKQNYFHTNSNEITSTQTIGSSGSRLNQSNKVSSISSDKNTFYGNILLNHKFIKNRRTLSLNVDINKMASETGNNIGSIFYIPNMDDSLLIDQYRNTLKSTSTISGKMVYTEPINKKWSAELSYEMSINNSNNNQRSFLGDHLGGLIDTLTNDFSQDVIINTPSAKINYAFKKYKFNFGSGVGITHFDLLDHTTDINYKRNYTNLFPLATFVYLYKSNHSFRIKYNGYNTQPTINQLQPLRNNTDLFNQFLGNPNLKPSFSNNINLTNNGYNFLKNIWNYQSLNITLNNNAITYNRMVDPNSGATISTPINTNGNYNCFFWGGLGFKIKKWDMDVQLGSNANLSRFADVINSTISYANTISSGLSCSFSKSKKEKYDISVSNDHSFNFNKNSQTIGVNQFRGNTANGNVTIYYKKVWSLISEYQYYWREKITPTSSSIHNQIWDLRLQRTLKKNEFTVYVKVKDLLNQNIGIDRNYFGNRFTEEQNVRLRRYYMLGFSWDFKNKSIAKK